MMTQTLAFGSSAAPSPSGRLALWWAVAGALASAGAVPYALALNPSLAARIPMPLPAFLAVQFMQGFVLLLLLSWAGLRLGRTVGLGSPLAGAFVYREPMPPAPMRTWVLTCVAGSVTALALVVLDKAFQPFMPPMPGLASVDLWKRMLACFYGGIAEELICRLFLMTLLVWALHKLAGKSGSAPTTWMIWTGIVGATVVFGLGHLPAAAGIWELTPVVVARTVLLNALVGIPFGVLYWRKGLEHAMVAHFCADIVAHVIVGT